MNMPAYEELLAVLRRRFEENPERHPGMDWRDVEARLVASPDKLRSLYEMERTVGSPMSSGTIR